MSVVTGGCGGAGNEIATGYHVGYNEKTKLITKHLKSVKNPTDCTGCGIFPAGGVGILMFSAAAAAPPFPPLLLLFSPHYYYYLGRLCC